MCNNNGNNFIAEFHNTPFAPDLCDGLFLIIMLMNLEHIFYLTEIFARCDLEIRSKMRVLYHIVHLQKMYFW